MDRRTFCRMAATGGSISLTAGLAGCVFGGTLSGDLGEITGDWPMTGRDLGHTRYVEVAPKNPDTVWVADLDDGVRAASTPALADGQLYVPADAVSDLSHYRHRLYGLTAATGELRWQIPLRADPNEPPAVSGNRIVISAQRDVEKGRVVAFDDRYGEEAWLYDIDARLTAPPTVSAPLVYIPDWKGRVHALDVSDGSIRWTQRIMRGDSGRSFATPVALQDDTLYLGSQSGATGVVALDANTGEERWSKSTAAVIDGPVVRDDLVVVRTHKLVVAFDTEGTRQWSYNVLDADSHAMAMNDQHVYVPSRQRLYAIDRSGGKAWHYHLQQGQVGTPTVAGDTVFLRRNDHLTALSRTDGTEQWTISQDGVGSAVVTPEAVFLARKGGEVAGLGAE